MGNTSSRPGQGSGPASVRRASSSAPARAPAPQAQTGTETETDYTSFFSAPAPSGAAAEKDSDAISLAQSYMSRASDRTLGADTASLYSTTGTVLDEAVLPPSDAIRAGMAGALDVLSGERKGWPVDVAHAQLEWLAQDAGRRARWLRAEVAMQERRAKRARRAGRGALSLGAGSRSNAGRDEFMLSLAGEERAHDEDAAVQRRLGMERMAGEHRAGAEALAHELLSALLAEHPLPAPLAGDAADDAQRTQEEAQLRQLRQTHQQARDEYHATCRDAADAHATALENARIAHAKAYSAAKIRYMGATLRAPQIPTGAVSMREASVGPIFE